MIWATLLEFCRETLSLVIQLSIKTHPFKGNIQVFYLFYVGGFYFLWIRIKYKIYLLTASFRKLKCNNPITWDIIIRRKDNDVKMFPSQADCVVGSSISPQTWLSVFPETNLLSHTALERHQLRSTRISNVNRKQLLPVNDNLKYRLFYAYVGNKHVISGFRIYPHESTP